MIVTSNGTTIDVTFNSPLSIEGAGDVSNYKIFESLGGVPVSIVSVTLVQTEVQSGVAGVVGAGVISETSRLFDPQDLPGDPVNNGDYFTLDSAWNRGPQSRVVAGGGGGTFTLDRDLFVGDPEQNILGEELVLVGADPSFLSTSSTEIVESTVRVYNSTRTSIYTEGVDYDLVGNSITRTGGSSIPDGGTVVVDYIYTGIAWAHFTPVEGVQLTINKPTDGVDYTLSVSGLKVAATQAPFEDFETFTAVAAQPQVVSAEQLSEGQLLVTFSEGMRLDEALQNPEEYSISGPSAVQVKTVELVSPTQLMLTTVGLANGSYTLTVNATGTPHDIAGNPIDPVFNTAIFTGSPSISSRSIFVDKGPITKPELSIQTGATATINTATQLTMPTATFSAAHMGLYIRLTGTATNAGEFRITSIVSTTSVRVVASFSLPDASNGAISWELYDPRDGEVADDPSDVTVRINGSPVVPDAVIGLLGQIILPSVPDPADDVEVDYCWICNPVVDVRRLNSSEFKLNNWNRDNGRPTLVGQHKYRYNNTLIQPETYLALDIRANIAQPLQRDLKYRAYERAYSVALNDPNLLLLNSPVHKIAFPPLSRTVDSEFVNYLPTVLPENNVAAPWEVHGSGTAAIVSSSLVVTDNTTGPFPGGEPYFWSRSIDLSYPHVFAIAWRTIIDSVTTLDGIFTGVAAGYSDNNKAVVVGFLNDGGTLKIGVLAAGGGNDPSVLTAWTGGIDGVGDPTNAPTELDWSILRSYRIFREQTGVITVYVDGSVVPVLQVLPEDLPFLEELNAPFNEIQGAFFGSLSREAENESTWGFVRYTSIPINPLQSSPSVFVSYEGAVPPEEASQPWTPVGFHGTETILSSDFLLLDSTSATDLPSSTAAGLVSGDFKGYSRIEPLLSKSFNTVLDINMSLRTYTHGITPNAMMAAVDDGKRLMQLCFFPETESPKFSYGGRAFPDVFELYLWNVSGGETPTMVGQYLQIADGSNADGLVYSLEDTALVGSDDRVVGSTSDYMIEFRAQVLSYTADGSGFCGVMSSVYDSLRAVGIMLEEIAGQRYVTLHSDGTPVAGGQFAFDWFDGSFHTYRATKSTTGDLVSLFVDGLFVGSVTYSVFATPAPSLTGLVSFGSATPISVASTSTVLWAYSNYWRVDTSVRKYAGIWKGYDEDSLTGYHLPERINGTGASVVGNTLTDPLADFIASGVQIGDQIVIDAGGNKGVYTIASVAPAADVTKVTITAAFPIQPSILDYRIVIETDWTIPHKYRMVKDPSGGVSVFLDALPDAWIHADYTSLDLPNSTQGIGRTLAGSLPSVVWGAFDPTNISQSHWDYVRLGAIRSQSELGIVPHHQVLNQRNVMASYEHHNTVIAHDHTNFWSESEGIPPRTEPDFLKNDNLVAYTLLNDGTPLVPSTQTYEIRSPQAVLTSLSGLNKPEDVLNDPGFLLNESEQKVEILVPDDVLYNCLHVIERTTGDADLIAPFDDECQPSLGTLYFQNEVCLNYDGSALPEDDTTAASPWTRVSDNDAHQFASAFAGVLTYGTDGVGTRTTYRNNTPLPDSIGLQTSVNFRLRIAQDSSGGLGDSQVRVGFSTPGATVGLAFVTSALGERYVLAVDLNSGETVGGIPFDFYDNQYHVYQLTRDPGTASITISIDP